MNEKHAKELIDRYVYDVSRRLPAEQRVDIERELRGLIDDMVQAKNAAELNAHHVKAVLKELGRPSVLAAKYRGTSRHLIGPDYYDTYWLVLKIVVAVAAFGLLVAMIVSQIASPSQNAIKAVAETIGSVFSGAVQAFAFVTIAFALAERFGKSAPDKDWDPEDLPPVPTENQKNSVVIKRSEPIVSLVFAVLGLVIFNAMPWILGYVIASGELLSVPVFNLEVLRSMLFMINVLIVLGMVKEVLRLIAGRYTLKLGIAVAIINAAMLVLTFVIFLPPAIWNADFLPSLYAATGADLFASQGANGVWTFLPTIIVVLSTIGYVTDTGTTLYRSIHWSVKRG